MIISCGAKLTGRRCSGWFDVQCGIATNLSCTSSSSLEDPYSRRPSAASTSSASSGPPRTGNQGTRYPAATTSQQNPDQSSAPFQGAHGIAMNGSVQRGQTYESHGQSRRPTDQFHSAQGRRPSDPLYSPSPYSAAPAATAGRPLGGGAHTNAPSTQTKTQKDEDAEMAERMMDW